MKTETQTSEFNKDKTLIAGRERRLAQIRQLNLFSDTFMTAVLKDKAACQYVLRILTSVPDLDIVNVRSQYQISQVASHSARLDVLAETEDKGLHSIEVQRTDTVDHARRTRFYGAMVDSEFLQRGKEYSELPEATIYYISETDIWKQGRLKYTISRKCDEADMEYDDGTSTVYVNAEVNDGSELAKMLQYF